jgi:hypothetical protein
MSRGRRPRRRAAARNPGVVPLGWNHPKSAAQGDVRGPPRHTNVVPVGSNHPKNAAQGGAPAGRARGAPLDMGG